MWQGGGGERKPFNLNLECACFPEILTFFTWTQRNWETVKAWTIQENKHTPGMKVPNGKFSFLDGGDCVSKLGSEFCTRPLCCLTDSVLFEAKWSNSPGWFSNLEKLESTFHSYVLTLNSKTGSSRGVQCHLAYLLHLQSLLRHLLQHLQFRVFCFLIGVQWEFSTSRKKSLELFLKEIGRIPSTAMSTCHIVDSRPIRAQHTT